MNKIPTGDVGVPPGSGKVKNSCLFDSTFFGIHRKLADSLDPLIQQALERSYEAVVDAGILINISVKF